MSTRNTWASLQRKIVRCQSCSRLISHCQKIAVEKRASYALETYWGRPVPNFGEPPARLLIVGLAPGAHGANRTGRMFTGDRSGEWLFRSLHRAGFANQNSYQQRDDGLELIDAVITGVCHCAPPDNRPTNEEIALCRDYFRQTWKLTRPVIVVALGQLAWNETLRLAKSKGLHDGANPKFGHLAETQLQGVRLIGSYHPSQQNTFTGRLTETMLDQVFERAREVLSISPPEA